MLVVVPMLAFSLFAMVVSLPAGPRHRLGERSASSSTLLGRAWSDADVLEVAGAR